MSQPNPRHGTLLPQVSDIDDDPPGIALPISQTEIEDLLYNDERPIDERIDRLREMREEALVQASAGVRGGDTRGLLRELNRAIDMLSADELEADETADFAGLEVAYEVDPADHLDTLSPDDEDGRMAIEGDGLDTTAEDESVSRKERLAAGGRERGNGHPRR